MGGIISSPKPPAPPPVPPPPEEPPADLVTEDRLRRQKAAGRQSNIVSSLANQVEDSQATSRISTLLG